MAAGLASRYGSAKQIDGVGPSGELLLEYSIFDARRAGFTRIVFIIRKEIEETMREFAKRLPADLDVAFAIQDLRQVPSWFAVPLERTKPWGTVHALLAAHDVISGPFGALNADDFYGAEAFRQARIACDEAASLGTSAAVLLPLSATLSPHGSVVRGISRVDNGFLAELEEVRDIARSDDGVLHGRSGGEVITLSDRALASMNFWVFPKVALNDLAGAFDDFLRKRGHDPKAESILPEAVAELMAQGRMQVRALEAPGPWFGLTHQADRAAVMAGLVDLTAKGVYPSPLWETSDTSRK
jgi:choline kinase